MVVCPSLSPFTMMKITTYGGRHLSHIQPFLRLSRVLFRARTFLLFNSLSLSNGKTSCRTASNLPSGNTFLFGESGAQVPREVTIFYKSPMKASSLGGKAFPFGESGAQAPREVTVFYKSTMKVFQLGGIWNSMVKPSHSGKGSRLNESVPTRRNIS